MPRRNPKTPPAPRGFTLIELAIVLFVVTLLLGGLLTPLGQLIKERQIRDTRSALEQARTALVGYALRAPGGLPQLQLPCPDLATPGPAGQAHDGLEDRRPDGRCAALAGLLPWRTLGLPEGDAWGNWLGYGVAPDWLSTADLLQVCPDGACPQPLTAAAVIVSHGPNGLGAHNAQDTENLAPGHSDEQENLDGDHRFIQRPYRAPDRPGGEFDDLLLPLSPDWLRGRLCEPASVCGAHHK
jgi:prepilin-type N-terminal cleavage/methylation domain-containing protein